MVSYWYIIVNMPTPKQIDKQKFKEKKDVLHKRFDMLWGTNNERTQLYNQLSQLLKVKSSKAHFSKMNSYIQLDLAEVAVEKIRRKHENKISRRMNPKTKPKKTIAKNPHRNERLSQSEMKKALAQLNNKIPVFRRIKNYIKNLS